MIEAIEALGIASLNPDGKSLDDLLTELLIGLPDDTQNDRAIIAAHELIIESGAFDSWFEAGEAVDEMLYPVRDRKKRIDKILNSYLPGRRQYWVKQCAMSALALRGASTTQSPHPLWSQLALVGLDINRSPSVENVPLMKHIAEMTVEAFEEYGR